MSPTSVGIRAVGGGGGWWLMDKLSTDLWVVGEIFKSDFPFIRDAFVNGQDRYVYWEQEHPVHLEYYSIHGH